MLKKIIMNEKKRFNIKDISSKEISSHIIFEDKNKIPNMICGIAPCRTGTTAQLKVFAGGEIDAYYQPIKSILRRIAFDSDYEDFIIPSKDIIFIKETIGPYSYAESKFNPIEVLENINYPKSKLKLIFEMRDPIDAYLSWINQFLSHEEYREQMLDLFILSYKTVNDMIDIAKKNSYISIPYIYESIKDNIPEDVISKLFKLLDIEFRESAIRGWDNKDIESKIHFAKEPEVYEPLNLHDEMKKSEGLKYNAKPIEYIKSILRKDEIEKIQKSEIYSIYQKLIEEQEKVFDIKINKDFRIKYLL